MLEMRVRMTESDPDFYFEIEPKYRSAGGEERTFVIYFRPRTDQWQTAAWRLAADEALPPSWRPQALVGLSLRAHANRPASAQIDWIRLRGFSAAEQQREAEWRSIVGDDPPAEPAVLRSFFPFGAYDDSSDVGAHHITHRHAFDVMARHHLNYRQSAFLHNHDGSLTMGPTPRAAEQTGMRFSARVRPALQAFTKGGADAVRAYVKPWVDAIAGNPVVIGWDIGDERPILDAWAAAGAASVLAQLDPTRPSSLCFFTEPHIQAYKPFLCLYLSDIYPLGFGRRPEFLYEWSYNLAKQTNNKRHWSIQQTFGNSRSRRWRSGAILPKVADLRLMTYGAIAGGARGIIYYSFNWDRAETLADQWCNPLNDLLGEICRIGERLIPIGRRLLDAEVDFQTVVKNSNEYQVIAGVLHAPKRNVHYLVVVNKNVKAPESATLELPAAWQDRQVMDLTSLEKSSVPLEVSLIPGDGQFYMIGSAEECETEVAAIRANRIEESLRVMTPDMSTARNWGLDLSQVIRLQQAAEKVVEQKCRLDMGEEKARQADELLDTLLAKTEPYAGIRSLLDRIGQRMGEVEPAMYDDHLNAEIVEIMGPFLEPYWQAHTRWAEAYGMLLEGQRAGLLSRVDALASDSEKLLADIHKALAGRSVYAS